MNENEKLPEIMTLKEVAAYFRCSERHMQNLILRGLPHFRLGSLLRFRKEEVLEFLVSNQRLSRHRQRQKIAESPKPC
jgi:excisionase family DNA binding protein